MSTHVVILFSCIFCFVAGSFYLEFKEQLFAGSRISEIQVGSKSSLFLGIVTMLCCAFDQNFTIFFVQNGGTDAIPLMQYFIDTGLQNFFVGKYALTSLSCCLLIIYNQRRLNFHFFSVSCQQLLAVCSLGYLSLVGYEITQYLELQKLNFI